MNIFNAKQSLGEIVSAMPKASEVFKKYNIDFCCGGQRPLSEAIKEKELNEEEILRKLDEAYEETARFTGQVDFRNLSPSELIDYIVNIHHQYLKRTLPEISELSSKILKVHGPNHSELFKVHKLFHNIKTELDQHLIKEEEILFPMIKKYDAEPTKELLKEINDIMKETEDEHESAGNILKELRVVTKDYMVPEDGCGTFTLTYDKLMELESDLFQHIHLENNILFKQLGLEVDNVTRQKDVPHLFKVAGTD